MVVQKLEKPELLSPAQWQAIRLSQNRCCPRCGYHDPATPKSAICPGCGYGDQEEEIGEER